MDRQKQDRTDTALIVACASVTPVSAVLTVVILISWPELRYAAVAAILLTAVLVLFALKRMHWLSTHRTILSRRVVPDRRIQKTAEPATAEFPRQQHAGDTADSPLVMPDAVISVRETRFSDEALHRIQDALDRYCGGDLAVRLDEKDPETGAIASRMNQIAETVESKLQGLDLITQRISSIAIRLSDATENVACSGEAQASQMTLTATLVSNLARQLQDFAAKATASEEEAERLFAISKATSDTAGKCTESFTQIKRNANDAARRIKKIGEFSHELNDFILDFDDLAEQASLIALNATLQNSQPNGGPEQAAAFSAEIQRIADTALHLRSHISALSQSIQFETRASAEMIEETIHEIVAGSAIGRKISYPSEEISRSMSDLTDRLHSIVGTARSQAKKVAEIYVSMTNIVKLADLVEIGAHTTQASAKDLLSAARALQEAASERQTSARIGAVEPDGPDSSAFVN